MKKLLKFLSELSKYVLTTVIAIFIYMYFRKKQKEGFSKKDLEKINKQSTKSLVSDIEEYANQTESSTTRSPRPGANWL